MINLLGIYFFLCGFLLTRTVLPNKSELTGFEPQYSKAIILVIDALRADYILQVPQEAQMLNKFHFAVKYQSSPNLFLSRFIADPPTTTSQRISGISAGILPTFIEASSNFNTASVQQDSWISKFISKKFAFYGDDTWLTAYPQIQKLDNVIGWHSFHLFDLHTVDNGIKDHLFPLLEKKDYEIVLAHFLGVDHCGHKYSVDHAGMTDKLIEMDDVVHRISKMISDDTLLIVFGDHGATEEGDHGGLSEKELTAGMFLYSKKQTTLYHKFEKVPELSSSINSLLEKDNLAWQDFFEQVQMRRDPYFRSKIGTDWINPSDHEYLQTVSQVDITPSIPLLLGMSSPFSNLGSIIPELFIKVDIKDIIHRIKKDKSKASKIIEEARSENMKNIVQAIRLNSQQIERYLTSYYDETNNSDFAPEMLKEYFDLFETAERAFRTEKDLEKVFFAYDEFNRGVLSYCAKIWTNFNTFYMLIGIGILSLSFIAQLVLFCKTALSIETFTALFIVLLHGIGSSSTSFLIFEDYVIRYLLVTVICIDAYFRETKSIWKPFTLSLFVRLSAFVGACREEQFPYCVYNSHRTMPFDFDISTVLISIISGLGILITCMIIFKLSRQRFLSFLALSAIPLLCSQWVFVWINETCTSEEFVHRKLLPLEWHATILFPRLLFGVCICTILYLIWNRKAFSSFWYYVNLFLFYLILGVQRPASAYFYSRLDSGK